jgi:hypothetical protein
MVFCGPLGMPVILRPAGNACYFAARWECLLFCFCADNDPFFGNAPGVLNFRYFDDFFFTLDL